jgi:hypothetical protein
MRAQWPAAAMFAIAGAVASPARAQLSSVSATFAVSPQHVRAGGVTTATLTLVNRGPTDAVSVTIDIGVPREQPISNYLPPVSFRHLSIPPNWTAEDDRIGYGYDLNIDYSIRSIRTARLPAGAAATFVAELLIDPNVWPGAQIPVRGQFAVGTARSELFRTAITVDGSVPLATAATHLSTGGANTIVANAMVYDPLNRVYLAHARGPLINDSYLGRVMAVDLRGAPLGSGVSYGESFGYYTPNTVAMAYSPDIAHASAPGGAMLVWQHDGIFTRSVATDHLALGPIHRINGETDTYSDHHPSIAYSAASRVFLVTWLRCVITCSPMAAVVNLDGERITPSVAIAEGTLYSDPDVAWNPVSHEFGVIWHDGFARISETGRVIRTTRSFGGTKIAVNSETGNYVAVARRFGGTFGIEINPLGGLVSRGVISTRWDISTTLSFGLAYNPVSGTFLFNSTGPYSSVGPMVELNRHGSPLGAPIEICSGATASRTDAAEWAYAGHPSSCQALATIRTSTQHGGSDLTLGGCMSADPFVTLGGGTCIGGGWLPPDITVSAPVPPSSPLPPPVPSGCTTPDPFVSLGGGTCVNGGWIPPGMAAAAPPLPPTPGACATPDPFVSLGGGVCENGGWTPLTTRPRARLMIPHDAPAPPLAIAGFSTVTFDASASTGIGLTYRFDFDDGTVFESPTETVVRVPVPADAGAGTPRRSPSATTPDAPIRPCNSTTSPGCTALARPDGLTATGSCIWHKTARHSRDGTKSSTVSGGRSSLAR